MRERERKTEKNREQERARDRKTEKGREDKRREKKQRKVIGMGC